MEGTFHVITLPSRGEVELSVFEGRRVSLVLKNAAGIAQRVWLDIRSLERNGNTFIIRGQLHETETDNDWDIVSSFMAHWNSIPQDWELIDVVPLTE